MIPIGGSRVHG